MRQKLISLICFFDRSFLDAQRPRLVVGLKETPALFRPRFLGPSPIGVSSAIPKKGCSVIRAGHEEPVRIWFRAATAFTL